MPLAATLSVPPVSQTQQHPFSPRESSTQLRRAYQATDELQRVDLVLRYAAPPSPVLTRVCLDAFLELARLGFFADGGLHAGAASARLIDDEITGSASIETCALELASVSPRGFDWLVRALRGVGAWVAGCTTVGDAGEAGIPAARRPANSIVPAPFGVASRRAGRGFYIRAELDRPVTDEDEIRFRELVTGCRRFALALPSREGHAHSRFTIAPSFERGGTVLGCAGREQDVASTELEQPVVRRSRSKILRPAKRSPPFRPAMPRTSPPR